MEGKIASSSEHQQNGSQELIQKSFDDFATHVAKGDLSEILLKGHLLAEHYLDHVMLIVFDKEAKVDKKSFYVKIKELQDKNCFREHKVTIACLYSLNKIRNELAHRLDFEVTLSQIDTIGYHLGKEYILRRYRDDKDIKELLLWSLREIILDIYFPIWKAALEDRKSDGE